MIKDENGSVKVREFADVVPLNLPSPGRVEYDINKFSRTLTPKVPTLDMMCHPVLLFHLFQQFSEEIIELFFCCRRGGLDKMQCL